MRACMGVALVAMTQHDLKEAIIANATNVTSGEDNMRAMGGNNSLVNSTQVDIDEDDFKVQGFLNALMLSPPYPKFKWNKKVQDTIISSFFWGYMILQIPAGQLAHRFGARYLLTWAMLINCIASVFLPLAVFYGGWICTAVLRVVQGLSQACIFPSIHTFFGKWAPLEERGRLTSFTYSGHSMGIVIGLPITGLISSSSLGWPGIFRFFGILSGITAGIVWWFSTDSPAAHTKISAAEKKYIENGLSLKTGYEKTHLPVPWAKIFRSTAVYSIVVAHVGYTWGQVILYSEVPAFMDKVVGINIKANGLLTALPFLVMWFTNFFFSWLTDMLIVKKVMTVTNVRKLANSMAYVPSALGLVLLAYVPKSIYVVESILVIVCAFNISSHMGFKVNHIDISPNFAGTLMGLSNFMANLFASFAPIVAGFILTDVKNEYLWGQVFLIAAGLYFFTNLVYVTFGKAEIEEWNDNGYGKTTEESNLDEFKHMLDKETGKL